MLNHATASDAMMNHYLLGTDSLAPVQLRLGMLGLTNPTYEVSILFLLLFWFTDFSSPGCHQVPSHDISDNVCYLEEDRQD